MRISTIRNASGLSAQNQSFQQAFVKRSTIFSTCRKIESGKLTIAQEPFNFAELITEVVELVRPQAEEKNQIFEFQPERLEKEGVVGDPLRIRQVCINILSNAVKYTPEGGTITLEISQRSSLYKGCQNFVFRCADTGIGMEPEFMTRLFQPFERSDHPQARNENGTGLGMAITKNLVDLMNGEIQVTSTAGQGSVFTVILPFTAAKSNRRTNSCQLAERAHSGRGR
ncbi:MAG: sensor histidine kinase [Holdemania filiformis]